MNPVPRRSLAALGLVAALTVAVGGAIASRDGADQDYGSATLVQAGYGPGGPPATTRARSPQALRADTGHDYGSATIIQLGHGPGGPHQPSQS
jgi:hypothetical protein